MMLRKNQKQVFTKVLVIVVMTALALTLSLPGWGRVSSSLRQPVRLTPRLKLLGKTYGEWSAKWLQWVAAIPPDINPLFGEEEVDLSIGQKGHVWFLAGSWVGPVERIGEVPEGKALFFPIFNLWAYNDPELGEDYTEEELRDMAAGAVDAVDFVHCSVDGKASAISYPTVRQQSPAFGYDSELLGSTDLAVMDGYWVMVTNLPAGEHEIHFDGGITDWGWVQDVTYYITVVGESESEGGSLASTAVKRKAVRQGRDPVSGSGSSSAINEYQFAGSATLVIRGQEKSAELLVTVLEEPKVSEQGVQHVVATHTFTFEDGSSITTFDKEIAEPTDTPGLYTLNANMKVVSGTGVYEGVSGHLTAHGTIDFREVPTAEFEIRGSISRVE